MLRVGIDIGGTFTDLFAWDEKNTDSRKVIMAKVLTTPEDPVIGFMNALDSAGISPSEISTIIHGTTTGTNALIERSYPEPALITTEGFRDTIEIGRQSRSHLYDPYAVKPSPLIKRRNRFTVSEKLGSDGSTVKPLNQNEAHEVVEKIKQRGIKNIAIAFINSYVDGRHEREMRDIVLKAIPDAKIALSSETRPKIRELGRFVTTSVRAALFPVVSDYITRLEETLKKAGSTAPLFIVKSNGGMMRSETARERPEELIRSGPAGGVAAGSFLHKLLQEDSMIITDVGGTSFDATLVENGEGLITDEYELEWELPIVTPMLDIKSIGAGGGSIAWIDDGNSLRVGPQSAGSSPGPACYGEGGAQPTVTDANLVLGRLNPTLSGKFSLDYQAAITAINTIAEPLGLSVIECAEGIIDIVCEHMADAIRMVSTERGHDPRDQVYVAFGGAGGLHASQVAKAAGINRILIPSFVGVDCAAGATLMQVRHDMEGPFYEPLDSLDPRSLTESFDKLESGCRELLINDGIDKEEITYERVALMRYIGQSYEVATPVPNGPLGRDTLLTIKNNFNEEHKKEYGVASEDFPVAIVSLRVTGNGETPELKWSDISFTSDPDNKINTSSIKDSRNVYFDKKQYKVDVHNYSDLHNGQEISGPAIIEHPNSEIVVPPNSFATVDKFGFINITLSPSKEYAQSKEKEGVL